MSGSTYLLAALDGTPQEDWASADFPSQEYATDGRAFDESTIIRGVEAVAEILISPAD